MGCTASKEAGEVVGPRPAVAHRPVEEHTWETDKDWANTSELFRKYIGEQESGKELALESRQPAIFFASVEKWLESHFRDCAYRGTIVQPNPIMQIELEVEDGKLQDFSFTEFVVMDPWLTGVVIASVLVVAVPVDEKKLWLLPGDMLNTRLMKSLKEHLVGRIRGLEQQVDFYANAEMIIVAGADMVRARWRPSVTEPAITPREEKLPRSTAKSMNDLGKASAQMPEPMRLYIPLVLDALLTQLKGFAPATTIWDEGDVVFSVNGSQYPHSARLLVTRDEADRNKDVEATEYRVVVPEWHPMSNHGPHFLWRNNNPEKDPGGIIALSLVISCDRNDPWPKVGDFAKGPVMKAAASALLPLLKEWNKQGKLQRCVVKVDMGFDTLRWSFVGNKFKPGEAGASSGSSSVLKRPRGAMDGFFVKVEPAPKHNLFQSEEHFQGIKTIMTERMLQDPERHKAQALELARRSAAHIMEMNFPGTEISFEADLPITFNDKAAETAFVVGKQPGKTEKDIVAAIYCIPSPDGELTIDASGKRKEWLGTPEAKAGVAKLLERMQEYEREGRIAEGECVAELMIGIDADIYLFKDGRFEDPSDERMAQFNWG